MIVLIILIGCALLPISLHSTYYNISYNLSLVRAQKIVPSMSQDDAENEGFQRDAVDVTSERKEETPMGSMNSVDCVDGSANVSNSILPGSIVLPSAITQGGRPKEANVDPCIVLTQSPSSVVVKWIQERGRSKIFDKSEVRVIGKPIGGDIVCTGDSKVVQKR
jgi:hypothetical protein